MILGEIVLGDKDYHDTELLSNAVWTWQALPITSMESDVIGSSLAQKLLYFSLVTVISIFHQCYLEGTLGNISAFYQFLGVEPLCSNGFSS